MRSVQLVMANLQDISKLALETVNFGTRQEQYTKHYQKQDLVRMWGIVLAIDTKRDVVHSRI